MDFQFTAEEERFRAEVRAFLASRLPEGWDIQSFLAGADSPERLALAADITKQLADREWLAMAWPREYGGQDAPHMQQTIFNEETTYRAMPGGGGVGASSAGPALMMYGSEEQKRLYLAHHRR